MLPGCLGLLVRIDFALLHFLGPLLAAWVVLVVMVSLLVILLLVLGWCQFRGLVAVVMGRGLIVVAGAAVMLRVIIFVVPATRHGRTVIDLIERARIIAMMVFHVMASWRVPTWYGFIKHLRLIKVLMMLSCTIRVHRAYIAARTATYVCGMIELLLRRWSWLMIFWRSMCTTATIFICLVGAWLLLLPRVDKILLFFVHCGGWKYNLSFGSWRHSRVLSVIR